MRVKQIYLPISVIDTQFDLMKIISDILLWDSIVCGMLGKEIKAEKRRGGGENSKGKEEYIPYPWKDQKHFSILLLAVM